MDDVPQSVSVNPAWLIAAITTATTVLGTALGYWVKGKFSIKQTQLSTTEHKDEFLWSQSTLIIKDLKDDIIRLKLDTTNLQIELIETRRREDACEDNCSRLASQVKALEDEIARRNERLMLDGSAGGFLRHPNARALLAGKRILIVDDSEAIRAMLKRLYSEAGAEVFGESTSSAGLAALANLKPDMILCDLRLPGEDGLTFMKKVRSIPTDLGKTPAIAMTGYPSAQMRDDCILAGFDEFSPKPIDVNWLIDATVRLASIKRS